MSRLRALLHELADEVADALEARADEARYYDQDTSPLPAATHCRLVRSGALVGYKRAGRILVERDVMHRYIESARVEQVEPIAKGDDSAVADALARHGFREAG